MPNRSTFSSDEEYRKWYQLYREKNRKKLRKYNLKYEKQRRKEGGYSWYHKNPEKIKAHRLVRYAIKIGSLVKSTCIICGEIKVNAHHKDYSKPLEVIWLCNKHHAKEHIKIKVGKKIHKNT